MHLPKDHGHPWLWYHFTEKEDQKNMLRNAVRDNSNGSVQKWRKNNMKKPFLINQPYYFKDDTKILGSKFVYSLESKESEYLQYFKTNNLTYFSSGLQSWSRSKDKYKLFLIKKIIIRNKNLQFISFDQSVSTFPQLNCARYSKKAKIIINNQEGYYHSLATRKNYDPIIQSLKPLNCKSLYLRLNFHENHESKWFKQLTEKVCSLKGINVAQSLELDLCFKSRPIETNEVLNIQILKQIPSSSQLPEYFTLKIVIQDIPILPNIQSLLESIQLLGLCTTQNQEYNFIDNGYSPSNKWQQHSKRVLMIQHFYVNLEDNHEWISHCKKLQALDLRIDKASKVDFSILNHMKQPLKFFYFKFNTLDQLINLMDLHHYWIKNLDEICFNFVGSGYCKLDQIPDHYLNSLNARHFTLINARYFNPLSKPSFQKLFKNLEYFSIQGEISEASVQEISDLLSTSTIQTQKFRYIVFKPEGQFSISEQSSLEELDIIFGGRIEMIQERQFFKQIFALKKLKQLKLKFFSPNNKPLLETLQQLFNNQQTQKSLKEFTLEITDMMNNDQIQIIRERCRLFVQRNDWIQKFELVSQNRVLFFINKQIQLQKSSKQIFNVEKMKLREKICEEKNQEQRQKKNCRIF